jgi:aromatic-ring opening dioxygenase LigAB LigA subunit
MYEIHQLLWDIRRHPDVRARYRSNPDDVLDAYGIDGAFRAWMKDLDFKSMYQHGVNPYLLYFCAIQLEVDRAAYYAQIRGEKP